MLKAPFKHSFAGTGVSAEVLVSGPFSVSIMGLGTWTVEIQRYIEANDTWAAVDSFSTADTKDGLDRTGHQYRFKCTAFTSGNPICVIEQ